MYQKVGRTGTNVDSETHFRGGDTLQVFLLYLTRFIMGYIWWKVDLALLIANQRWWLILDNWSFRWTEEMVFEQTECREMWVNQSEVKG